jgi:hypothetical protein
MQSRPNMQRTAPELSGLFNTDNTYNVLGHIGPELLG